MKNWKALLKNEGFFWSEILIIAFFVNCLSWFSSFDSKIITIILFIIMGVLFLIWGLRIGEKTEDKGFLAGIKFAGLNILIMILLSWLLFGFAFSISQLLYYVLIILITTGGAIVGVNRKKP